MRTVIMKVCSGMCTSNARLDGKTAIVTGSNTGIGKVTAEDFFKRGARVIMACRNEEKAMKAVDDIKKNCAGLDNVGQLVVTRLDLTSLKCVRECATKLIQTESKINLLINNAGVMMCPQSKTEDGFEMQFGTNHLGHFLLTLLLLPKIIDSTPARIVNVSSLAHARGTLDFEDLNFEKRPYSSLKAYQQSKLANVLFTKELSRRIEEAKINSLTVYSLHPGVIKTELGRHLDSSLFRGARWLFQTFFSWYLKTPDEGAQTTIHCAVDEDAAKETGLYYSNCKATEPSEAAKNLDDAKKLWEASLNYVGLEQNYNPFVKK